MDASQLAAAKQSLLDTEIRKQRSSSFSTHVSSIVEAANVRLTTSENPAPRSFGPGSSGENRGDVMAESKEVMRCEASDCGPSESKSPNSEDTPPAREVATPKDEASSDWKLPDAETGIETEEVAVAPNYVMVTVSGLLASSWKKFKPGKHRNALKNHELTTGDVYTDGPFGRILR